MIHKLADVQTTDIGEGTMIWQYSVVLKEAKIGSYCNINCHTFIENDVVLGDYVTVKSGVYLWDGISIDNNAFIGPNVTFTNDRYPRSKQYPRHFQRTIIEAYASIGAAATVLGGVKIGAYAMVGAGALVTKDVPARSLVVGSPARVVAWLNENGTKMLQLSTNKFQDDQGSVWIMKGNEITKE